MSSSGDTADASAAVPDPEPVREGLEQELALLDEQWQVEQERHYADYSPEGETNPELPNPFRTTWSFVAGVSIIGFGVWHMTMGGPGPFFLGLVIVLLGIWFPLCVAWRHYRYLRACQAYQRRRAALKSMYALDHGRQPPPDNVVQVE